MVTKKSPEAAARRDIINRDSGLRVRVDDDQIVKREEVNGKQRITLKTPAQTLMYSPRDLTVGLWRKGRPNDIVATAMIVSATELAEKTDKEIGNYPAGSSLYEIVLEILPD